MSNYTKLFINAIEKSDLTMEVFVKSELSHDNKLRDFITLQGII